jgi:hypothetical protein
MSSATSLASAADRGRPLTVRAGRAERPATVGRVHGQVIWQRQQPGRDRPVSGSCERLGVVGGEQVGARDPPASNVPPRTAPRAGRRRAAGTPGAQGCGQAWRAPATSERPDPPPAHSPAHDNHRRACCQLVRGAALPGLPAPGRRRRSRHADASPPRTVTRGRRGRAARTARPATSAGGPTRSRPPSPAVTMRGGRLTPRPGPKRRSPPAAGDRRTSPR